MPGIDRETVRDLPKGAIPPLRQYARLAPTRSATVRSFAQALADRHGVTRWTWHRPYTGHWELDAERLDGTSSRQQVARELADDPAAGS